MYVENDTKNKSILSENLLRKHFLINIHSCMITYKVILAYRY